MRIISGRFKGHKLTSFDEPHIRPTTDRVKESVFNILSPFIPDATVLDLFSGTGNLSFESLSWGARSVQMVEINPRSIAIIKKNMEHLKINEGVRIYKGDAVTFVKKYNDAPFDIILIDPPFPLKICNTILEEISKSAVAHPETRIVIEHSRQEPLAKLIPGLRDIDTRSYGDKLVTFFKKEG